MADFQGFQLCEPLLKALAASDIHKPTAIQAKTLNQSLNGESLLAQANTGSGKTLAFALPVLQSLYLQNQQSEPNGNPRSLILAPTRELAQQIRDTLISLNSGLRLRITLLIGGQRIDWQWQKLQKGTDIIVATPGRLLEMLGKHVRFEVLEHLVFDEADRMFDLGFAQEIETLMAKLPKAKQLMLFSATFDERTKDLAAQIEPDLPIIKDEQEKAQIQHRMFQVAKAQKFELLLHLLKQGQFKQALIFTKTKRNADELGYLLAKSKQSCAVIHGDKTQGEREQALQAFKQGEVNLLIATDVAARGIDIDRLPVVINYDFPKTVADYIHRVGRTARAGKTGQAISLVNDSHQELIAEIALDLLQPLKVRGNPLAQSGKKSKSKAPEKPKAAKPKAGIIKRGKGRPGISF